MKLHKFLTTGLMSDIKRFVETQTKYPFTMRNIFHMLDLLMTNRETLLMRSLVEAVEKFTQHTHENRYHVEGWKTNDGHLLARKFIIPYCVEWCKYFDNKLSLRSSSYNDGISDLIKVLCYICGRNFDEVQDPRFVLNDLKCQPNTWYFCSFFRFKGFKKGTLHLEFQNESEWETLNRAYAKAKGYVLPETTKQKPPRNTVTDEDVQTSDYGKHLENELHDSLF
jgi:hypothetical protein